MNRDTPPEDEPYAWAHDRQQSAPRPLRSIVWRLPGCEAAGSADPVEVLPQARHEHVLGTRGRPAGRDPSQA